MSTTTRPLPPRLVQETLLDLRDFVVSMKLTLVLLGFSMVLVFAATLDQVNLGIWAVQEKYFRSFLVSTQVGSVVVPVFPGGYLVGGLLLINLVAAHFYRFALTWRKAGIQLVHFGLIILLVGELLTGLWQEDAHLRLNQGETKNYAESFREFEVVLSDVTDPAYDEVVAIPIDLIARKAPIQHPKLPFTVDPKSYYPNSTLMSRRGGSTGVAAPGGNAGEQLTAVPQAVTYRPNEDNIPAAIIELTGPEGSLGKWLVSAELPVPQEFSHAGRSWRIALRLKRAYLPVALTLLKFSHDRYAGTEIPKNFSSRLRLATPDGRDDREVLIYMNNPLRYGGRTFYQAGFQNNDRTTVLQVVRNPSWAVPYVACTLMTIGLTLQFCLHLFGFIRKRRTPATSTRPVGRPNLA